MSNRFGQNLRKVREKAGLTQEALASKLGMAKPAPISIWERGSQVPTPRTILRLAAALGCEPADLMAGVVTPTDALRRSIEEAPDADALVDDGSLSAAEKTAWLEAVRHVPADQRPHLLRMVVAVGKYAVQLDRGARGRVPPATPGSGPTPRRAPAAARAKTRRRR